MPTLRYIGPIDEVDVVGVGVFGRGDEFEATDEQAKRLLEQGDNYEPVKATAKKKG